MTDDHEPITRTRKKRSDALPEEERKRRERERSKAWREKNKERASEYFAKYREEHKEERLEYNSKYRAENAHKWEHYSKTYRERNRDKINEQKRSPGYREVANKRYRERYAEDLEFRLRKVLRSQFQRVLSRKSVEKEDSVLDFIGCSLNDLVQHLTSQFAPEMTWENYGEFWEIDHIRPCASFDMTLKEDRQACWHWTNLQPLTQEDNRRKSDRW
jgi:hypothetical protein